MVLEAPDRPPFCLLHASVNEGGEEEEEEARSQKKEEETDQSIGFYTPFIR
jgi:hypothetical protein